jgi:CheY-like chemotaxis protein
MRPADRLLHDARAPLATLALEIENLRHLRDRAAGVDADLAEHLAESADTLAQVLDRARRALEDIAAALIVPPAAAPHPDRVDAEPEGHAVLVVEDEPLLRRALARRLGATGPVAEAASLAEARALLLERTDIGAIVADAELGDGTLAELLDWLYAMRPRMLAHTVALTQGRPDEALHGRFPAVSWARKPDDMSRIAWFVAQAMAPAPR